MKLQYILLLCLLPHLGISSNVFYSDSTKGPNYISFGLLSNQNNFYAKLQSAPGNPYSYSQFQNLTAPSVGFSLEAGSIHENYYHSSIRFDHNRGKTQFFDFTFWHLSIHQQLQIPLTEKIDMGGGFGIGPLKFHEKFADNRTYQTTKFAFFYMYFDAFINYQLSENWKSYFQNQSPL